MADRDSKTGQFLTGSNGGPGRKLGSRNKLGADFIDAVHEKFQQHGADCLDRMIKTDPTAFIKVVGNILPRETIIAALHVSTTTTLEELTAARDFSAAYRLARDMIGVQPPL